MISSTRSFYKKFFSPYGVLFFIFICSFCLRLPSLYETSFWLDEVYSLERSGITGKALGIWESITYIAYNDAHPPGYYLLLRFWSTFSHNELWLRLLSVLLDSLSVVFTYLLIFYLSKEQKKAIIGASVLAFSCFLIHYAQEIRHYSLSNCIAVVSSWCLVKAIFSKKVKYYYIYIPIVTLGFYTYYYLAFLFMTQGIILFFYGGKAQNLIQNIKQTGFSQQTLSQQIHFAYWVKSQLVATILFFPWLYYVLPLKVSMFSQFEVSSRGSISFQDIYTLVQDQLIGISSPSYFSYLSLGLILITVIHIVFYTDKKLFLSYLSMVIGPILIVMIFPFKGHIFQSKHLIYLLPFFIIAITVATKKMHSLLILVSTTILLNISGLYFEYSQQEQPWKSAISYVYENVDSGDVLCFNPYYLEVPSIYYYKKQGPIKGKEILPAFVYLSPQQNIPKKLRPFIYFDKKHFKRVRNRNVWVIELTNCHLAPREYRIHSWCQKVLNMASRKMYSGKLGNIVITKYKPKKSKEK